MLLVYDLHTPKRFYNMLRVAKSTSPMSIGTWILMGFSGARGGRGGRAVSRPTSGRTQRWACAGPRGSAACRPRSPAHGLSTYTASLLAATSTPLWAAAPQSLAVRFGASSMATAASALALGEAAGSARSKLDAINGIALATEAAATAMSHAAYRQKGVEGALDSPSGQIESLGATKLGMLLPLGLLAVSALAGRSRRGGLSDVAALAALAGSAMLRVSIMGAGDVSAERPDVSFRFSRPKNLPEQNRGSGAASPAYGPASRPARA